MYAIFYTVWVRKLIGKPEFLTISDWEFETPRIQYGKAHTAVFSPLATKSNAFRIQQATSVTARTATLHLGRRRALRRFDVANREAALEDDRVVAVELNGVHARLGEHEPDHVEI